MSGASRSSSGVSARRAAPHFRRCFSPTAERSPQKWLRFVSGVSFPLSARLNKGRVAMRSAIALLILIALVQASAGCSLIFTKGPQPEVQPPPPCTTDNTAPTADTVLAVASVAAVVAGAVVYVNGTKQQGCGGWFCGFGEQVGGGGAMVAGVLGTLIFTPSAIVGFNRTAACRAWLETNPQYAPPLSPSPPESSLLVGPPQGCPTPGDAPRICSSAASWRPRAVVLGDVTSRGGAPCGPHGC